jgi:transposase-like protein
MAGKSKIAMEIKSEILRKAKDEGVKVSELATQYGISTNTIHSWLKTSITPGATYAELSKLKRQNEQLTLTLGYYAAREAASKKGVLHGGWSLT